MLLGHRAARAATAAGAAQGPRGPKAIIGLVYLRDVTLIARCWRGTSTRWGAAALADCWYPMERAAGRGSRCTAPCGWVGFWKIITCLISKPWELLLVYFFEGICAPEERNGLSAALLRGPHFVQLSQVFLLVQF